MILSVLIFSGILSNIAFSSEQYRTYHIESDKVCPLGFNGKILTKRIATGSDGLIIRENTLFDNLTGKHSLTCRFEVETGHKSQFPGLFAVFQKLRLRKNPVTGNCIDYVKIRPADKDIISEISNFNFNLKKNKSPWEEFCGDLSAQRDGSQENPHSSGLAVTGFLSDSFVVEVEIYISKIPTFNESLQLEIAFTPYLYCKNMWSEYKDCGMSKCIKKPNFNDGVVNCPFVNCPDEEGCGIINESLPPGLRTKVTLTAVTSIFCSFFLFLGCVWCCRYFELLCWSANTLLGRPNPLELSPMAQPSPSAPPPDTAHSKDLPPAYETLFPERCTEFRSKC